MLNLIIACSSKSKQLSIEVEKDELIKNLIVQLVDALEIGKQEQLVLKHHLIILDANKTFEQEKIVKGSVIEAHVITQGGQMIYI